MLMKKEYEIKLENLLKQYIADCSTNQEINIRKCNLITDLNFNSFTLVQLIVDIEEAFGFKFNDSELSLEKFTSFNEIIDQIIEMEKRNKSNE